MTKVRRLLETLASVELTLFSLGLMMLLVFFGTIAQVHLGTYIAQKEYFHSVWVYAEMGDWKIPIFPGGLTVGGLWFINLLAAFIVRFRWDKKSIGILISHAGIILLLIGQFLSQALARERQMPVDVGETRSYSEDFRDSEIVLLRSVDEKTDEVTSIPYSIFTHNHVIALPGKSISLAILKWMPNAQLGMADPNAPAIATQGIGARVQVQEMPPVTTDDENNQVTAYVEVLDAGQSLGIWLLSSGLGAPQSFISGGQEYRIYLRPRRYYHPFAITLKEFKHDVYLGTDIPKNFSSLLHIDEPSKGVSRDTLVYMNHPLRYEGLTFYQASFAKGDQQSIFQVVQNPAWLIPYMSCALIIFGMALQFGFHLLGFLGKRRAR
jgi:hypothetical protein